VSRVHAIRPSIEQVMGASPVVPVVVVDDAADAVPLATALWRGGVGVIEITLRTPSGLESIRRVAEAVPDMIVGAGTVIATEQVEAALDAGASFLVTPGAPPSLLDAALDADVPLLAGAATVTEMMTLLERGLTAMKFFPAEPSGGRDLLAAVAGPLPQLRFCPTGGITAATAPRYLALSSVPCVGGSWLTPKGAVREGRWDVVETLAREAAALAQG
jgi:2-dehydro-3-deoxyphosphogluconate aldolase / (4S)-4-hydroxy-2-oxoglutarate aldolase